MAIRAEHLNVTCSNNRRSADRRQRTHVMNFDVSDTDLRRSARIRSHRPHTPAAAWLVVPQQPFGPEERRFALSRDVVARQDGPQEIPARPRPAKRLAKPYLISGRALSDPVHHRLLTTRRKSEEKGIPTNGCRKIGAVVKRGSARSCYAHFLEIGSVANTGIVCASLHYASVSEQTKSMSSGCAKIPSRALESGKRRPRSFLSAVGMAVSAGRGCA